jgi:glycosyltransferase involved in cell wall biosynthesis
MQGAKLLARKALKVVAGLKGGAADAAKARRSARTPMISVVIPAHNEEDYIAATLEAVNRQNYPHFEVIVVANGCTDRTALAALDECERLVVLSSKSLGIARNLGAKLAEGELLLFLDADTILEPGALEIAAHKMKGDYAVGTFKGRPATQRPVFRLIYAMKNFLHRWSIHEGSSGVIVCRRDDFLAVRGFDEALEVRENSELIHRLRGFGRYLYLDETTAITSMRRYENGRAGSMIWFWFKLWVRSFFNNLRGTQYDTVR